MAKPATPSGDLPGAGVQDPPGRVARLLPGGRFERHKRRRRAAGGAPCPTRSPVIWQLKGPGVARRWYTLYRVDRRRFHKALGLAREGLRASHRPRRRCLAGGRRAKPSAEHLKPGEARHALADLIAEARLKGPAPAPSADEARPACTLRRARDEWLRDVESDRQRKRSTVNDYRGHSERYLLDELDADPPLEQITTGAIEDWQQHLLEGFGAAQRRRGRRPHHAQALGRLQRPVSRGSRGARTRRGGRVSVDDRAV